MWSYGPKRYPWFEFVVFLPGGPIVNNNFPPFINSFFAIVYTKYQFSCHYNLMYIKEHIKHKLNNKYLIENKINYIMNEWVIANN